MRKVATIEFYVHGDNEQQMKNEAEQIAKELRNKYDNDAKVVSSVRNEFGKLKSE